MNTRSKQIDELRQLAQQSDRHINTSDIPEVVDWSGAERGRYYRPVKQQVTLRIAWAVMTRGEVYRAPQPSTVVAA